MVPEKASVRPVEEHHVRRPVSELLRELQAVALRVYDDPLPQLLHLHVLVVEQGAQKGVGVALGLRVGEDQAHVDPHLRRRLRQDFNEGVREPPAEAEHLNVVVEVLVQQVEVAQEGAHAEGEEDEVADMQHLGRRPHVRQNVLHGLVVALLVEAVGVRRVAGLAELLEVRGPARLADVDCSCVCHPEIRLLALDPLPISVEVGANLGNDHVVPPEEVVAARTGRADRGGGGAVQPSMQLDDGAVPRVEAVVAETAEAQLLGHLPFGALAAAPPQALVLGAHRLPLERPVPHQAVVVILGEELSRVGDELRLLGREVPGRRRCPDRAWAATHGRRRPHLRLGSAEFLR
mmetsp:Transcript_81231/g.159425  ORF Transcript_81231/g.159425 Transcript_81231/m.159425 type:complete len:348 (+) Transcript_81231:261-1304(+)